MNTRYDVVIVGAGHAGVQMVAALEKHKCDGTIGLLCDETVPPYERPPLSKDYLARGGAAPLLRSETYWESTDVQLQLATRVTRVDPDLRQVQLSEGGTVSYGSLVWAAGADARRLPLPGADAENVIRIRRLDDINRLRRHTPPNSNVVIIGGGYIGLETAAVLNKLGHNVVVVEALDRVLARVTSPTVSRFYQDLHREHGVRVELDAGVTAMVTVDGLARSVELASGESLPADVVIVGIGAIPNVEPLVAAGAVGGNGIAVDERCRTTLPDIYAIGDCALQSTPYAALAGPARLESVPNANSQAKIAAADICGVTPPPPAVPWFWSHQYDVKLQTAGLFSGHDEVLVRGEPGSRRFSVLYLKDGCLLAADCVNSPADFAAAKHLVGAFAQVDASAAADPAKALKSAVVEMA